MVKRMKVCREHCRATARTALIHSPGTHSPKRSPALTAKIRDGFLIRAGSLSRCG